MADQDKSKGFSLRSKKSRREGIRDPRDLGTRPDRGQYPSKSSSQGRPSNDGDSTDSRVRPRPKPSDTTSNLVKKRYSIRYNQIPDINLSAPPLPAAPPNQQFYDQQDVRNGNGAPQGQGLDLRALRDPNLQADQYVAGVLANATEKELLDYQKDLQKVKNRASTDLQNNVYRNRTQFIKISKEAEKLKGEMQTLQGLMNELSSVLEQAAMSSGSKIDDGARKRNNRSSVANLEAMWSTQLQALWKNIEGSQKFVAAIPGRHITLEQGGWTQLDAATWKPRRPAHIILLNDHLLVATRKRKRTDPKDGQKAPTKLVAERCWPLLDIELVDITAGAKEIKGPLRDLAQITGAITIRYRQESFTYRNERPESKDKTEFVAAFKRAVEELRRTERAENNDLGNKNKETMNYLVTRDPAISRSPGLLRTLSKSKDKPELLIHVDGVQRNMRWVEAQIDELDIEVALQRFDEAVDHVEQLRKLAKGLKNDSVAQDLVTIKVDERASKLADILTQRLIADHSHLTPTQTYTSHLSRLDFASRARIAYLSARTTNIRARARQCVFEGNILAHITQLSYVYFTLVRNTVSVYQQCFPSPMMSACVTWAKGQLDEFNEALGRALSGVERGGEVWREGLARAREQAKLVDEVGLDFGGLVGVGLESG